MTGDTLTALEYATRQAQLALRSPWFVVAFNVVTLTLMIAGLREQWNYLASWLAIMVEWIVGTFMFGQTKRDAVVLRETRALAEQISRALVTVARDVERIEDVIEDVVVEDAGETEQTVGNGKAMPAFGNDDDTAA